MRSPGRGRGGRGTGARASAFRDGVATIPVVGLRMRLSVRQYECGYAKQIATPKVAVNEGNHIWRYGHIWRSSLG